MKKILSSLCSLLLVFSLFFIFSGCKNQPEPTQVTLLQIRETLKTSELPQIVGYDSIELVLHYDSSDRVKKWQYQLEIQNIDSSDLRAVDYFYYKETLLYKNVSEVSILKFANTKSAKVFYKQYDVENDFVSKQYGNIVVVSQNTVSDYIFNLIDNI